MGRRRRGCGAFLSRPRSAVRRHAHVVGVRRCNPVKMQQIIDEIVAVLDPRAGCRNVMAALILTEVAARRVFNTVVVSLDSRRMEDMKARRQRAQKMHSGVALSIEKADIPNRN